MAQSQSQPQAFLITGATGSQGGAVARALLAASQRVHALVRDPSSAAAQQLAAVGAQLFKGDFSDSTAIASAASGCTGVFINVLPTADPNAELNNAWNVISATRSAGVMTCVYTSVVNAEKHSTFKMSTPDGTYEKFDPASGKLLDSGPWAIIFTFCNDVSDISNCESGPLTCALSTFRAGYWLSKCSIQDAVHSAGFASTTVLQPAWLLSNLVPPVSRGYFHELAAPPHTLRTAFTPSTKIAITDPADIGKFAARAFLDTAGDGSWNGWVGPVMCVEAPTMEDIARVMGEVSGQTVRTEYLSEEEFWQQRVRNPLVASQGWARDGWLDVAVERLREVGMEGQVGTLKGFLEREREAVGMAFDG